MTATILPGCCLTQLAQLPANSIDCVVTSPPYWGLRDYGVPPTPWPKVTFAPMPGLQLNYKITIPAETTCLGLEPTLDAFIGHLVLIFEEIRRILKPTGTCWINMGDGYATNPGFIKPKDLIGQPWRLAFALQAAGWYLRSDIIWHKPNPMPESTTDRATKSHEYLFLLTKSKTYFFDTAAWAEPSSEGTHARISQAKAAELGCDPRSSDLAAPNGWENSPTFHHTNPKAKGRKMPDGWDTGKGGHGSFHREGREKGKTTTAPPGVKNNASMDAEGAIMPLTRNKRTVWTIPTQGYKDAHYATYPPDLIRPCIRAGTSTRGCCITCGAPWQRLIEQTGHVNKREASRVPRVNNTKTDSTGWAPVTKPSDQWSPTCACPVNTPVPATVLDPFGGSGTTAQVALEEGRHAILIEVGPQNIALIHKRLASFTPGLRL